MRSNEEVLRDLERAKITLLTRSMFLASISFELRHRITEDCRTARTDGLTVEYNPVWFGNLNKEEQAGLLAHEIWHVAFDHIGRCGDKDPKVWNYAGDYIINHLLIKAGYTLPKDGLYNPNWGSNMSTDDVYDILIKDAPNNMHDNELGIDICLPGSLTDGFTGGTNAEKHAAESRIAQILSKAKTAVELSGDGIGQIPGEIQRRIEEILNPVIDWNQYLQRFCSDITKNDYSWKKANRRFLPDFYLPSQSQPTIGDVTIAVDTSGSIGDRQLLEIYSEIENIRVTFSPRLLTIIACDKKIHDVIELYEFDDIRDLDLHGGGGTSFKPVMDYCNDNPPQVLLYFTDLQGETLTDEPAYPNLWVCYSNHKPQGIGETIYYTPKAA